MAERETNQERQGTTEGLQGGTPGFAFFKEETSWR